MPEVGSVSLGFKGSAAPLLGDFKKIAAELRALNRFVPAAARGFTGLTRAMAGVGTAAQSIGRQIFSLKGLLAGLGLSAVARSFFSTAIAMQQAEVQLRAVLGSTEAAKAGLKSIRDFANDLPFSTQEVVEAFVLLKSVGVANTQAVVENLSNVAIAMNRDIGSVATAFVSLESETLRRLGVTLDRTGDKAVIMAQGIRIETEKTTKAVQAGLLQVFEKNFGNAIALARDSFTTALKTMGSEWAEFQDSVVQGGLLLFLTRGLQEFAGIAKGLREAGDFKAIGEQISDFIVGGMSEALLFSAKIVDSIRDGWLGTLLEIRGVMVDITNTILRAGLEFVGLGQSTETVANNMGKAEAAVRAFLEKFRKELAEIRAAAGGLGGGGVPVPTPDGGAGAPTGGTTKRPTSTALQLPGQDIVDVFKQLKEETRIAQANFQLFGDQVEHVRSKLEANRAALQALLQEGFEASSPRVIELRDNIRTLEGELKTLEDTSKKTKDSMLDDFRSLTSAFGDFASSIISGNQSIGESFKQLALTILRNELSALQGGGKGGFLQSLIGVLSGGSGGGIFSGLGGGGTFPSVGTFPGATSLPSGTTFSLPGGGGGLSWLSGIGSFFGFHEGGVATAPMLAQVGDTPGGEAIIPLDKFSNLMRNIMGRGLAGGGGGRSDRPVVVNAPIQTPDPGAFRRSTPQIEADMRRAIERGLRNV